MGLEEIIVLKVDLDDYVVGRLVSRWLIDEDLIIYLIVDMMNFRVLVFVVFV